MAAVSERKRYLEAERLAPDVADAAFGAGIAPCPAEAVVEQVERLAGIDIAQGFGVVSRQCAEDRRIRDRPRQRLGIMRCDDAAGEGYVSEILAIGVSQRVRQARRAGKSEFSAGARKPGTGR